MKEEQRIENEILDYLAINDIKAWKIKSVGTFDPKKLTFRRPGKRYKKGVADILGIYKGKPLAIEVKSKTGRLSPHQKIFLMEWFKEGGIVIVARSVGDVEQSLRKHDALALEQA